MTIKFYKIIYIQLLLLMAILTTPAWSQHNGYNYKAIIKDNLGNVVANQTIDVQFQILEEAILVYQETHTPTTDANGLITLTIGNGTTSDEFSDIVWSRKNHNLNVQIDIGSGFVDMGTTAFQSVPYASNANGLELINEGNGSAWRLTGVNPDNYGTIGANAIDLSISLENSTTNGATGNWSFAANEGTIASGLWSSAFGFKTKAEALYSASFGSFNTGGGDPLNFETTDPIFQIGNGQNDVSRSNALTILKNGTITAPSFDIFEITDDKALITKEYAEANLASSGLEAIDEGNGIGWRLKAANPFRYDNIGLNAVDLSITNLGIDQYGASGKGSFASGSQTIASGEYSNALGQTTTASGNYSIAVGSGTTASGDNSASIGINTTASGFSSVALGSGSIASQGGSIAMGIGSDALSSNAIALGGGATASGEASVAIGQATNASGNYSISIGFGSKAEALNSVALGRHNIGGGDPENISSTDPIFEIGNGTNDTNRSNALTILRNGTITAPSFDISEITDNKALITKEYLEANGSSSSGLEAIDEGNGIGWRLKNFNPDFFGNIGENATDLSTSDGTDASQGAIGFASACFNWMNTASGFGASAFGNLTTASGTLSIAAGFGSVASGESSFAIGASAASGRYSFAANFATFAGGENSFSANRETSSIGENSSSFGEFTRAESLNSFAIGYYNIGGGNPTNPVNTDPLFEIGNGTSSNRSNALTVYKSGVVNINDAYSLPPFDGSSGQTLITDGNGEVRWQTISIEPGTFTDVTTFGTNYGPLGGNVYEEPRYYIENNRVYIEGTVQKSSGTPTAGDVLFTLPAGFRPVKQRIFTGTQDGNNTVRVDVTTTGNVVVLSNSPVTFISLDGISFRID